MTPKTPLTLEFQPNNIDDDDATCVVEPSLKEPGRVFIGVYPAISDEFRVGVHMLPDEARRVRDHISKLLLEPGGAPEEARPEAVPEDVQSRIDRAVERIKAAKPPKRRFKREFRLEFQLGRVQAVIGSLPRAD